jgi:ABC-type arginine/histidine transport system permease subunit
MGRCSEVALFSISDWGLKSDANRRNRSSAFDFAAALYTVCASFRIAIASCHVFATPLSFSNASSNMSRLKWFRLFGILIRGTPIRFKNFVILAGEQKKTFANAVT